MLRYARRVRTAGASAGVCSEHGCTIRFAATLLAVLLSAPVALAQDVKLTYKWTSGETIRYRMLQQTTSTISGLLGGSPDVTVEQLTDQVFRATVESVAADGSTALRETIE